MKDLMERLLKEEFFQAAAEVRQARNKFNRAEPEYFEIANAELTAAEERFSAVYQKMKLTLA